MKAELFAVTQPFPVKHKYSDAIAARLTPESSIVFMARVSSQNQTDDNSEKLLTYLIEHNHWSPFDMVDMTLKIETSRAIMAQILRHWSFRFQEFSQRYSTVTNGLQPVEIRAKADGGNRQGSGKVDGSHSLLADGFCEAAYQEYNSYIKDGMSPESARMILPLATTTTAYMKGSVRSWMTYFWQRLDSHAQKEHRELAELMFIEFSEVFPIIASIIVQGRPGFVKGSWIGSISQE